MGTQKNSYEYSEISSTYKITSKMKVKSSQQWTQSNHLQRHPLTWPVNYFFAGDWKGNIQDLHTFGAEMMTS